MDQPRLVQQGQTIEQLLGKDAHKSRAQAAELVLLDEFVEVYAQQLKHQAQVLPVDEGVLEPQEMVVIVLVQLRIELGARVSSLRGADEVEVGWRTKSRTDTSIMLWLK